MEMIHIGDMDRCRKHSPSPVFLYSVSFVLLVCLFVFYCVNFKLFSVDCFCSTTHVNQQTSLVRKMFKLNLGSFLWGRVVLVYFPFF